MGAYSTPTPPAGYFASQGDAHMRTDAQINGHSFNYLQITMNFLKLKTMKNAIKYWSRMNELTFFNWKCSKKTRKLSKNDKFVSSKTKICLFY